MECRICGVTTQLFQTGTILGRHKANFFLCVNCRFVQTETPYWLKEAYSSAITTSDIGYISRNIAYSRMVKSVLMTLFNPDKTFIDFGGGYGMFVRLMRDLGFDFRWQDKYCANLFAGGFEAPAYAEQRFEALTAFEVFEHLPDPIAGLREMLKLSDAVIFSTSLLPSPTPALSEWEYYGLEHGQHISFYSYESLQKIAEIEKMHFLSYGGYIHLLTRKPCATWKWKMALNRYSKFLINLIYQRGSLLFSDSRQAILKAAKVENN